MEARGSFCIKTAVGGGAFVFLGVSEQEAPKQERGLAEMRARATTATSEGIRRSARRKEERLNGGMRGGRPFGGGTGRGEGGAYKGRKLLLRIDAEMVSIPNSKTLLSAYSVISS